MPTQTKQSQQTQATIKTMQNASKGYAKMMKHMERGGRTDRSTIEQAKKQYIIEYKDVIESFFSDKEAFATKSGSVEELFKAYCEFFGVSLNNPVILGSDVYAAKITAGAGQSVGAKEINKSLKSNGRTTVDEYEGKDVMSDENLSGAQLIGIGEVSKWMLRNCEKTGVLGDTAGYFVRNYILQQPARIKLAAYYLVETDSRKLTGEKLVNAIMMSQTYTPNLENFKKKMIATKFKVWKRLDGSEFYWGKLEDSMRYAVSLSGVITQFGNINQMDNVQASGAPTATAGTSGGSGSGSAPSQPADQFTALFAEFIDARNKHFVSLKEYNLAKGKDPKALQEADQKLKDTEAALRQKTQQVISELKEEKGDVDGNYEYEGITFDNSMEAIKTAVGTPSGIMDQISEKADWAGSKGEEFKKLKGYNHAEYWITQPLNSLNAVLELTTTIIDIVKAVRKSSYTSVSGKIQQGAELTKSILDITGDVASIVVTSVKYAGKMGETAANVGTGTISAIKGGFDIVKGGYDVVDAGIQRARMTSANKSIQADKNVSASDKKTAGEVTELQHRLARKRQASGTMNMISGTFAVASGVASATGLAAPVGIALSAVSAVIGITAKVIDKIMSKYVLFGTVDEYIHMDELMKKVKEILAADNNVKVDELKVNDVMLRSRIRLEAAAQLGYYSVESLYNGITKEFATFLYNKVMVKRNGDPIKPDPNTGKLPPESEFDPHYQDYKKMLSALGLKPDYKKGKPSIETIQKKFAND